MITPFTEDGAVDYGRMARLAVHLVETGHDGLVVSGSTGESPTLSDTEKLALYSTVSDAVRGKAVVVAGTGTYDTRHSVEMSKKAADLGVDAIMAVCPYYSRPSQAGLLAHFLAIADATDLPVMVYNIPIRTARLIEAETLAEMSAHPNIVATKDGVGDLQYTQASLDLLPEGFMLFSGDDSATFPMLEMGGVGVVSVAGHLAGRQIKRMIEAHQSHDPAEARRLHDGLMPLFDACFVEPNPMPVKAGLNALWEPVGAPRLPLVPASTETRDLVVAAVGRAQRL
ncbi:MAG: 4-hydroxy-tetrahydrodipicolinate synthase [Acidimicrobiia bacterium]|nr:4-hydroxy-tetrahydrodipicolinate synthase [Acidimicrobiia bacterium]MXZ07508.1 4-hydroxy-tetrahydrodipicolinate synthase [Acidimicrobiia bacterium]MYD05124.1 4-hydroxy-tetrahydrodipicolinate synthase [Acidimicrobiia bacterium]MYH56275.1 4-hydroxy-tetrahydrodipicolinate synthase [Acidimicrobiia bacterium]